MEAGNQTQNGIVRAADWPCVRRLQHEVLPQLEEARSTRKHGRVYEIFLVVAQMPLPRSLGRGWRGDLAATMVDYEDNNANKNAKLLMKLIEGWIVTLSGGGAAAAGAAAADEEDQENDPPGRGGAASRSPPPRATHAGVDEPPQAVVRPPLRSLTNIHSAAPHAPSTLKRGRRPDRDALEEGEEAPAAGKGPGRPKQQQQPTLLTCLEDFHPRLVSAAALETACSLWDDGMRGQQLVFQGKRAFVGVLGYTFGDNVLGLLTCDGDREHHSATVEALREELQAVYSQTHGLVPQLGTDEPLVDYLRRCSRRFAGKRAAEDSGSEETPEDLLARGRASLSLDTLRQHREMVMSQRVSRRKVEAILRDLDSEHAAGRTTISNSIQLLYFCEMEVVLALVLTCSSIAFYSDKGTIPIDVAGRRIAVFVLTLSGTAPDAQGLRQRLLTGESRSVRSAGAKEKHLAHFFRRKPPKQTPGLFVLYASTKPGIGDEGEGRGRMTLRKELTSELADQWNRLPSNHEDKVAAQSEHTRLKDAYKLDLAAHEERRAQAQRSSEKVVAFERAGLLRLTPHLPQMPSGRRLFAERVSPRSGGKKLEDIVEAAWAAFDRAPADVRQQCDAAAARLAEERRATQRDLLPFLLQGEVEARPGLSGSLRVVLPAEKVALLCAATGTLAFAL
jgi:hypothetical protein